MQDPACVIQESRTTNWNSLQRHSRKSAVEVISANRSGAHRSTPLQLQIRSDKKRFYRERNADNISAANRIAESRFNSLRRDDYFITSAGTSRNDQKEIKSGNVRRDYRSKSQDSNTRIVHHDDIGSENFLQSGKGALEIADSFLNGNLFQQLLRSAPDSRGLSSNERSAQNFEGYRVDRDIDGVREHTEGFAPIWKQRSVVNTSNQSGNEIMKTEKSAPDSKYLDGWRATKGGWVSDFGPLHTHTLSALSSSSTRRTASLISGERNERMKSKDATDRVKSSSVNSQEENGNSNYFEDNQEKENGESLTDHNGREEGDLGFSLLQHVRDKQERTIT